MELKRKVVLLPTKDKASDILLCINDYADHSGTVAEYSNVKGNLCLGYGEYANTKYYEHQHLYFLSDEKIEAGDWCVAKCLNGDNGLSYDTVYQKKIGLEYCDNSTERKIIATTDTSLRIPRENSHDNSIWKLDGALLPQPSTAFIQKFIEGYNRESLLRDIIGKPYLDAFLCSAQGYDIFINTVKQAQQDAIDYSSVFH